MRTYIGIGKTDCLSIRLEEVPGLNHSLITKLHKTLDNENFGIKNDRRCFLSSIPTQGTKLLKVNIAYINTYNIFNI